MKYLADHEQAALREFLTKLREQHGSEVVLVSLFGSKVRGDFDEDTVISSLIMGRDNYEWHLRHRAPLYRNVEREGIELWTSMPG